MSIETKKKRKRGPKPDPANKREKRVSVYFSDTEYEKLVAKVGDKKLLSDFLRNLGLGKKASRVVIPEINSKAYSELARTAANLNQVAKAINTGDPVDIEQIQTSLKELRFAIIGAELR